VKVDNDKIMSRSFEKTNVLLSVQKSLSEYFFTNINHYLNALCALCTVSHASIICNGHFLLVQTTGTNGNQTV
jgi:uncharacterized membrane protein